METKSFSPRRPRGSTSPEKPLVTQDHGQATSVRNYSGSIRSLFGQFRRQPSRSSLRPNTTSGRSLESIGQDTYFGAFDNLNLGSSVGLESPRQAHELATKVDKMLSAAAKYRQTFEALSVAAAEFGNTLYECAETKGAESGRTSLPDHSVNTDLQAAGGLHLLISNHANILASSLGTQVETPVKRELDEFNRQVAAKEVEFKAQLRKKMADLREAELQRLKDSRRRDRDLGSYRNSLLDITYQIDDISRLKVDFLGDLHTLSTEIAEAIHSKIASAVTAEIEVFESVARKGWTGGGLDGLLAGCPDPFDTSRMSRASVPKDEQGQNVTPQKHSLGDKKTVNELGGSWTSSIEDYEPNHVGSSGSERSSTKSPNLFSIIPPGPIFPTETNIDDDVDSTHEDHTPYRSHLRTNSDISEIADLTLTPSRLNNQSDRDITSPEDIVSPPRTPENNDDSATDLDKTGDPGRQNGSSNLDTLEESHATNKISVGNEPNPIRELNTSTETSTPGKAGSS